MSWSDLWDFRRGLIATAFVFYFLSKNISNSQCSTFKIFYRFRPNNNCFVQNNNSPLISFENKNILYPVDLAKKLMKILK